MFLKLILTHYVKHVKCKRSTKNIKYLVTVYGLQLSVHGLKNQKILKFIAKNAY